MLHIWRPLSGISHVSLLNLRKKSFGFQPLCIKNQSESASSSCYQEFPSEIASKSPAEEFCERYWKKTWRVNFAQNLSFPKALEFRELCPGSTSSCEYRQTKLLCKPPFLGPWLLSPALLSSVRNFCTWRMEKENPRKRLESKKMLRGQNQIFLEVLQ